MFSFFSRKGSLAKKVSDYKNAAARILHCEDEILSAKEKETLKSVIADAGKVELEKTSVESFVSSASERIETAFPKNSVFHTIRDWLDVIAVALAVAFGIRALYLQPFKIPTSSMQPTLFGIHYAEKKSFPDLGPALNYAFFTTRKVQIETKDGGRPYYISEKGGLMPTVTFGIGTQSFTVPGSAKELRAYFDGRMEFSPGEKICDGWLSLGDHLFVDRFSIHFLGLNRGDVVVFTTEGIEYPPNPLGGFYYIKRLVGMPGDTLKIERGVLLVKPKGASGFKPVYEISGKFKKVYSMKGGYQGHVIPEASPELKPHMVLSEEGQEVLVPDDSYFMMGDNTTNSLDSRYWGFVPRRNIVGTAGVVFWPFSRRWGIADSKEAIDTPTALPRSMWLQ